MEHLTMNGTWFMVMVTKHGFCDYSKYEGNLHDFKYAEGLVAIVLDEDDAIRIVTAFNKEEAAEWEIEREIRRKIFR